MVDDFIDEHHGFLRLTSEEHELAKLLHPGLPIAARVIFKFGTQGQGYWNNEQFITQVELALKIPEFKNPPSNNTLLFPFRSKFWPLCLCRQCADCSQNECVQWREATLVT